MLYGIRVLLIITILSLFPRVNNFLTIETLEKNEFISCRVSNANLKEINCEVNGTSVTPISGYINVPKSEIKGIGAQIHLSIENVSYHLVLSFLGGFKDVLVDDSVYYIGYHLKNYGENEIIIKNKLSYKIEFVDIFEEKNIPNIFAFSISLFKGFYLENKIEQIESYLYVYLDKDIFPYLTYTFSKYIFPLIMVYENGYYYFILKNKYELKNNTLLEKKDGKINDIIFPNNFNVERFYCSIKTIVFDVVFNLNYCITIKSIMNGENSFIEVENYNGKIECDKTIISTYK